MRTAWIMLKKELFENWRKNRFLVMGAVLFLFGILSPVTAKYLPEILTMILGSTDEVLKLGIKIPDPTIFDSYLQFFKNLTQMGIFIQILVFMNLVSEEKSKGTAVMVLTKAVPRSTFILSKFVAACIVIFSTLLLSCVGFYYYTYLLFGKFPSSEAITGIAMYFLFSVFILAFTLFASTISKSVAVSALISIGGYFGLSIFSVLPKISDYLPMKLTDAATSISMGLASAGDYVKSLWVTAGLIVVLLVSSIVIFQKQEL